MKPIIRVENLSKQYRIGTERASYGTLRDSLTNAVTAPFRRFRNADHRPPTTDHPDTIWALKDINFEVMPGEVVGIIGRNGAGKSTLLKILSRITEPTTGRVDLYGRVGSLLEVGTGFHAELTGRENIYLNGAVLGLKRDDIKRRFDAIVDFAEIEKFLDTPVKHYSSGMYMRLAFAVAAHLDPEILIVDEVLAVGDAAFQRKCLAKMGEVSGEGRTVLFVSHIIQAVGSLCSRMLLLEQGNLVGNDVPSSIIAKYLDDNSSKNMLKGKIQSSHFSLSHVECYGERQGQEINPHDPLNITLDVTSLVETRDMTVHILIRNEEGALLLGLNGTDFDAVAESPGFETITFKLHIANCPLPPGSYWVDTYVNSYSNQYYDYLGSIARFDVSQKAVYGQRPYEKRIHGEVLVNARYEVYPTNLP